MYVPIYIQCLDSISMVVSIIGDKYIYSRLHIAQLRNEHSQQLDICCWKYPKKRPITFKGVYSTGDMITMSCIRRSDVIDLEN